MMIDLYLIIFKEYNYLLYSYGISPNKKQWKYWTMSSSIKNDWDIIEIYQWYRYYRREQQEFNIYNM